MLDRRAECADTGAYHARDVIIHGKVDGNIRGTDEVELERTAVLVGDITDPAHTIEDGAYFKGAIDVQREAKEEEYSKLRTAAVPSGVGIGAVASEKK